MPTLARCKLFGYSHPVTSMEMPSAEEERPQAGPLPTKRGEIGFDDSLHAELVDRPGSRNDLLSVPDRHPADRPLSSSAEASDAADSTPDPIAPVAELYGPKQFFNSGVRLSTILLLACQCLSLLVTIILWVVVVKVLLTSTTAALFIHMPFALGAIIQIVFLERTVFRLRAERYAALHPGEVMPATLLHRSRRASRLPMAPWNRPPLPNYAAVLQELHVGTGDVEDNRIAIPPPPAYGITRGSKMVLTGFITEDQRDESRRIRLERGESLSDAGSIHSVETRSRPMSYVSQYDEYEARCDMTRARVLSATLDRLQNGDIVVRS